MQDAQYALKQSQSCIAANKADLEQAAEEDPSMRVLETVQLEMSVSEEARCAKNVSLPELDSHTDCVSLGVVIHLMLPAIHLIAYMAHSSLCMRC